MVHYQFWEYKDEILKRYLAYSIEPSQNAWMANANYFWFNQALGYYAEHVSVLLNIEIIVVLLHKSLCNLACCYELETSEEH
jgi:hypothetical protein